MGKTNFLSSWTEGISKFAAKRSAQSYMFKPAMAMASSACGSSCGAGEKEQENKPSACGSACGAGDKEKEQKPSACGSACGAGDK
jgi:ACGX-repeat protein